MRRALALLVGLVAGFLFAEAAARLAFRYHGIAPPTDIAYDRELGWTLVPGVRDWQSGIDYGVWVATDADGLRVDDRGPQSSPPSWPTLLVLGDSYAFGYGVPGDAMFAAALERELSTTPTPYRVRTAGVPGYSTDQELLQWRRLAPVVKPRRVVLLFHESDLIDNVRPSVVMGPERYFKPRFELHGDRLTLTGVPMHGKERVTPTGAAESFKERLRPLAIYALVQSALLRARPAHISAADQAIRPADAPPEADDVTRALIGELARETHEVGADLSVALVPADPVVTARVSTICRTKQLPLIDLRPAFTGARDTRLPFDGHWNARGHALAAHAVAAALQQQAAH